MRKLYWAVVEGGAALLDAGELRAAVPGGAGTDAGKFAASPGSETPPGPWLDEGAAGERAALTRYRVRARHNGLSWLELEPITGSYEHELLACMCYSTVLLLSGCTISFRLLSRAELHCAVHWGAQVPSCVYLHCVEMKCDMRAWRQGASTSCGCTARTSCARPSWGMAVTGTRVTPSRPRPRRPRSAPLPLHCNCTADRCAASHWHDIEEQHISRGIPLCSMMLF